MLYATDASIYQVEPIGVVVPRDRADAVVARLGSIRAAETEAGARVQTGATNFDRIRALLASDRVRVVE